MAWVLIVCSLVLVWVACLCKILHGSSSPFRNSFLNTGGAFHKRNVLLVIAHPDDESMFFSPTINYLTSTGHNLHVLCLSTGDADGKGNIKKEELYQACAILKIITFDYYGVSSHCNHCDVHYGVWLLVLVIISLVFFYRCP